MVRLALGVVTGFLTTFVTVVVVTWVAMAITGLAPEQAPTGGYLTFNLIGTFGAAVIGGLVAARIADRRAMAGAILAALILLLSLGAIVGEPAATTPRWYPPVVALLGVTGAALGGLVGGRRPRVPGPAVERNPSS